ncbi:CopY/TcrY family copper transport repressor [Marinilactibacillus sp. GCM10026970]|uniref:CopY/TcrY family copper transport repressor n=1 Tax=Marinilactibacillus sp. GCM10026970 TaxID=3252642 RepID=UPI00361781F5
MKENQMTTSEREVMRVIWANPSATSKYISTVLEEKMNWKAATTKTLIGRLVKKNHVKATEEGRKFKYSALITEQESLQESSQALLQQVCTKKRGNIIYQMIEEITLSLEDIEQLEQLLNKKKQSAPETVSCQCTPGQCECKQEGGVHCGH